MGEKLETKFLREKGLELLALNGHRLRRDTSRAGQIYTCDELGSVRLRSNNDRNLPCKSSHVDPTQGTLDIEGTDYLYWVVPTKPRGTTAIEGYLVPTDVAASMTKNAHKHWLDHEGKTKGVNLTPALFLDKIPSGQTQPLRELWVHYRVGQISVD